MADERKRSMAEERAQRSSLWPFGLALALAAMIASSLAVLGIAIAHPDPAVVAHPLVTGGTPSRAAH